MEIKVSDIIWPESINQSTINGWIYLCPQFIYFIYVLVILIMLVSICILKRKHTLSAAIRKSIIISLSCSAIIYAGAYEFIWSQWLQADISQFYGKSVDNKQVALNGDFYKFIMRCKAYIGNDNYSLYPDSTSGALHFKSTTLQYYLLPARKRPDSKYLIVLSAGNAWFDSSAGILHSGENVIRNVKLCYMFDPDTYILRIGK